MQITGEDDLPVAKEIAEAPDRSTAILATSWLEEYLTTAIKSRLVNDKDTAHKLFKPTGPLGALAVKAEIGYLMSLYSKESRDDLVHISGIRNYFAHWTKTIDFGSRDIRVMCEKLTSWDRIWSQTPFYEEMKAAFPRPFSREHSRKFFIENVCIAVNVLNNIAFHADKKVTYPW